MIAKSKGRSTRSGVWVLGLSLALAGSACGQSGGDDDPAADEDKEKDLEGAAIPVHSAKLTRATFADQVKVYGRVNPRRGARILVEQPGRIDALNVDDGDRVRRGAVLARINTRVLSAQRRQAKASLDLQTTETERTRRMVEKKLAPPQQLDLALAQKEQAAAALELVDANLSKATIRAPFAGVVTDRASEVGEVANMGQPLLAVVDVASVYVMADVPERDVALLQEGTQVKVKVEAYEGKLFDGVVEHIGLMADGATRTFPMKILINNKDGLLRPGMLASLQLERRVYEDVVVVPRDAVIDDVEGKTVYVVEDGRARSRAVTLGPTRGRYAVALTGVSEGDELIVLGHRQVVDAQKVTVTDKPPCCKEQLAGKPKADPVEAEPGAAPVATGTANGAP